jgi:hypothetical protein
MAGETLMRQELSRMSDFELCGKIDGFISAVINGKRDIRV